MPADARDHRYFFIHVMKTAGATFVRHILDNFDEAEVYPTIEPGLERQDAYLSPGQLLELSTTARDRYRVFTAHHPYATARRVAELDGDPLVTITMLRDPVERKVSMLRMTKRRDTDFAQSSLEQIYDDATQRDWFLADHQMRVFAQVAELNILDPLSDDFDALETAKANLERVDVIGFQDDLAGLLAEMRDRFGWRTRKRLDAQNVGTGPQPNDALRRRIEADSAAELEFFEFAQGLAAQRSANQRTANRR